MLLNSLLFKVILAFCAMKNVKHVIKQTPVLHALQITLFQIALVGANAMTGTMRLGFLLKVILALSAMKNAKHVTRQKSVLHALQKTLILMVQ